MEWDRIGRNKGCFRAARDPEKRLRRRRAKRRVAREKERERERGRTHSPWLLFLDRFLRRSLRSVANPNSKSFSLIFGFGRFIVSPLKIRSTGSVVHNNGKSVSVLIRRWGRWNWTGEEGATKLNWILASIREKQISTADLKRVLSDSSSFPSSLIFPYYWRFVLIDGNDEIKKWKEKKRNIGKEGGRRGNYNCEEKFSRGKIETWYLVKTKPDNFVQRELYPW